MIFLVGLFWAALAIILGVFVGTKVGLVTCVAASAFLFYGALIDIGEEK